MEQLHDTSFIHPQGQEGDKVEQECIISESRLTSMIVNRKVDINKQKVDWFSIHWIHVQKGEPLHFKFRHTLNTLEAWKTVDLRPIIHSWWRRCRITLVDCVPPYMPLLPSYHFSHVIHLVP